MSLKKQLNPLFFPVRKVSMEEFFKTSKEFPVLFNPSLTHVIVAQTPDGDRVVNVCSKNYSLIPNKDLMAPLIEKLDNKYDVTANISTWDYSKFYTDFIIKDIEMNVQPKDKIYPRIRMNNSYDGSVKYQFGFGFYRQVCSNGLMAPVQGMQSKLIKLRHTPSNSAGAVEKTIIAIDTFIEEAPKILKGYDPLIKAKMSMQQLEQKIQEVLEETKFPKKKEEEVMARILKEKEMGLPLNQFALYNAFNHVLYQNESKMKQHKRDKIDLQVLRFISNNI